MICPSEEDSCAQGWGMFVMSHHMKLFNVLTFVKTSSVCGFIIFLDVMTFVSTTVSLAAGVYFH